MSSRPISVLDPHFKSSTYSIYACGLKPEPALILNRNPIFEMIFNQINTGDVSGFLLVGGLQAAGGFKTGPASVLSSHHPFDRVFHDRFIVLVDHLVGEGYDAAVVFFRFIADRNPKAFP